MLLMSGENRGSNSVLVIIPAYNEAAAIESVVAQVRSMGYPVLVVDDASTDETARCARRAGARVITLPVNGGYGVALQTGYRYAWRNGFDYIVQLDGDGQHDPKDIGTLLDPVRSGACDLAIGSRFLGEGSYRVPLARRMGIRLFSLLLSLFTGRRYTDPTSGFQAANRRTLRFFISDAFPRDYPDADMLLSAHRIGLRIKEIPVVMRADESGKSMHTGIIRPLYYVFRMTMGILVTLMRKPPDFGGDFSKQGDR